MDICHCELEPKLQTYKGRVVLQGDIVKNDSWACAVFTEEGSSASQTTAAKIMDVIANFPDCEGQAADAVSAYTQVKMDDAPRLLNIPKSKCPDACVRPSKPHMAEIMVQYGTPSCSAWKEFVWSSFGRTVVGTAIWRSFDRNLDGKKVSNWECLFVHRKQGLLSSDIRWWHQHGQEKAEFRTHVEKAWRMSILRNRHHFLITFIQDALNVNANQMTQWMNSTQRCLNHVFLQEQLKDDLDGRNSTQKQWRGPTMWKDTPRSVWKGTANVQTRKLSNYIKFQLLARMIINSKQEKLESVGELSEVCSQIVLKCLYLARIGRPDILWSVNKMARAVTKRTQTSDKRVARLIAYIHHIQDYRQYCHVGNTGQHCRFVSFQDSDFAGDLEDSKSTSGGILCLFGSRTFVPVNWMCKKNTTVSQSSTESEIISLDAGLWMDGPSCIRSSRTP